MFPEAVVIELNPENTYFIELFWSVNNSIRSSNAGGGLEPFDPDKILSWANLAGRLLSDFEKKLLLDMDRVFRSAWHDENNRMQDRIRARNAMPKRYSE